MSEIFWKVKNSGDFVSSVFSQCLYYLLHLEEVLDGWNVTGTFRPPVVVHILSDLRTNTGCRCLRSDHNSVETKKKGGRGRKGWGIKGFTWPWL